MSKLLFFIVSLLFSLYSFNASATDKVIASVNGNAITNKDIEQRVAFLKMQHVSGDLKKQAKEQLITQMLKTIEIQRHKAQLSNAEIDKKFTEFAQKNGMDTAQLSLMLAQHNIDPDHFKNFIATQIGWQKLLIMRFRAEHGSADLLSEQETAHRQIESGAEKPKTWEYQLQKITFVMPDNPSAKIKKARLRALAYFKHNFKSCDSSYDLASKLLDIVINEEGRMLEPQLPTAWEKVIKNTKANSISEPIQTPEGLVAFAVCDKREVDDDRVAQLIYSINDTKEHSSEMLKDLDAKYLSEIRSSARIVE